MMGGKYYFDLSCIMLLFLVKEVFNFEDKNSESLITLYIC